MLIGRISFSGQIYCLCPFCLDRKQRGVWAGRPLGLALVDTAIGDIIVGIESEHSSEIMSKSHSVISSLTGELNYPLIDVISSVKGRASPRPVWGTFS